MKIIEILYSEFKYQPLTMLLFCVVGLGMWWFEASHADDAQVVSLTEKVDVLIEINTAFEIRQARRAWCATEDQTARQIYEGVIDRFNRRYREATGTSFMLPECENESGQTD